MSEERWHVRRDKTLEASFETLQEAEQHAKRSVRAGGEPREIWRAVIGSPPPFFKAGRVVAAVRRDAFGKVWVDVLDSTLA